MTSTLFYWRSERNVFLDDTVGQAMRRVIHGAAARWYIKREASGAVDNPCAKLGPVQGLPGLRFEGTCPQENISFRFQ